MNKMKYKFKECFHLKGHFDNFASEEWQEIEFKGTKKQLILKLVKKFEERLKKKGKYLTKPNGRWLKSSIDGYWFTIEKVKLVNLEDSSTEASTPKKKGWWKRLWSDKK